MKKGKKASCDKLRSFFKIIELWCIALFVVRRSIKKVFLN